MYTDIGFHVEDKNIGIECNIRHFPASDAVKEFSTLTISIVDFSQGIYHGVGSVDFFVNGDIAALKAKFESVLEALK